MPSHSVTATTFRALLLLLSAMVPSSSSSSKQGLEILEAARAMVLEAHTWADQQLQYYSSMNHLNLNMVSGTGSGAGMSAVALADCARLYEDAEPRLTSLVSNDTSYSNEDARIRISAALTNHRTCLDGLTLREEGNIYEPREARNLSLVLSEALALYAKQGEEDGVGLVKGTKRMPELQQYSGILASWNPTTSKADMVVAKDGSGDHRTIREAVAALSTKDNIAGRRVIVHVKAGVYNEKVEIGRHLKNIMLVGDGIDRTVVTGSRNFIDGDSTVVHLCLCSVSGDGFWARDMTFENTAGPRKHQAVALMVSSDHSLYYRCGFRGYQDTLYAHPSRQFYRDCHIYGTIDFIFGNAAAVFQNCDIFVRRPMSHQDNTITAQGRENPHENTGLSIHGSRVRPAPEFASVTGSFKTFLGRPWKKYSRTVISRSYLDGLVHPRGWTEWDGGSALSTLYYAEYMNSGAGPSTVGRLKWPGFHELHNPKDIRPFTVKNFIQGDSWILRTGVPVLLDI
ncbi:hypothetical protein Ancab_037708 [Ancistrocladus abbreviatus]